jgi:hypothetical protein
LSLDLNILIGDDYRRGMWDELPGIRQERYLLSIKNDLIERRKCFQITIFAGSRNKSP